MDKKKNFDGSFSKKISNIPSPIAEETFFYILETGCLMTENRDDFNSHKSDSFIFVAVTNGICELILNGQKYSISKGECFFIDCRLSHFCQSSEDNPCEVLWVHFNGGKSEEYYEFFSKNSSPVFKSPYFNSIVSKILEIISINDCRNINAEIITSKLIVELLTYAILIKDECEPTDTALKQKLENVYEYITANFRENITLSSLSSKFYISKYYLTREFKKLYGITIFQHIINSRIDYAKKQLRFSDKSIEEIAHSCGFNDQSYFVRQFRKVENVTCLAYRKMWRD